MVAGLDAQSSSANVVDGQATRAPDQIRVPVIDPVAAAVKQAEALIALPTMKASLSSFRRPASKAKTGLPAELTAHWEGAQ
jgi:allantoin racemase